MRRPNAVILIIMLALMTACFQSRAAAAEKLQVFVSIPPQKYFVEKIGGGSVDISVMVAPHQNHENFEPLPSQMAALSKADVYFAIGVPFEDVWLEKFTASYPGIRMVHTDDGIDKKTINRHADDPPSVTAAPSSHSHHPGGLDPHVWLSPPLVMIQARRIRDTLVSFDPARAPEYEANFKSFMAELNMLDRKIKNIFATAKGEKKFLVFHPAWGYFADAYGLTQISIEIEGKEPKAQEVAQVIEFATRHNIRTVFVQPQFSTKHAEIIAREIGGRIEAIDPLAANWDENLLKTATAINASFGIQ